MTEIRRSVVKQSGRSTASRLLNAKSDKETIAGWKSDLNRILHVFNVRSTISLWLLLTARLQTELAMNTHVIASDIHHGVVNTHAMVSDIHRTVLGCQDGTGDQYRSVSDMYSIPPPSF